MYEPILIAQCHCHLYIPWEGAPVDWVASGWLARESEQVEEDEAAGGRDEEDEGEPDWLGEGDRLGVGLPHCHGNPG